MQHEMTAKTEKYIRNNRNHRIWIRIVAVLILMVLFGTTYLLIRPVVTMESGVYCQKEEHTHTIDCYEQIQEANTGNSNGKQLICGQEEQTEHVHTEDCYKEEQVLICETAETEVHTHTDSCWNKTVTQVHTHTEACYVSSKGALTCTETEGEGHTHGNGCYTAQKGSLLCTLAEGNGHTHTDACYTESVSLICGKNESAGHTHSQGCCDEAGNVVCGQQESAGHTHTDACRQVTRTLSCGQTESAAHWHSDSCYAWDQVLTCTQQESAAHHHTDSCYEWTKSIACGQDEIAAETELICSKTYDTVHEHTDACYENVKTLICTQTEAHVHSEACYASNAETEEYKGTLNCTKNHQHTELCYGEWKLVCKKEEHEHELICYSDKTADLESASIWEKTMANVTLTGDWTEDIIAIAESQLGYSESIQNYIVNEEGKKKGYSRYGAWYGDPYGDWCAMFVSFCLNYAEISRSDFPYEAECQRWIQALSSRGMYTDAANWEPKTGDIIFFDNNGDGISEHVGIVAELIAYGDDPAAQIRTIEGNTSNGHVAYKLYSRTASGIKGYGILPETLTYAEEDQVNEVIEQIAALPKALEADAVQKAYTEAEDTEGRDTYLSTTTEAALEAKVIYESMTELQKEAVTNAGDLETLLQLLQELGCYEDEAERETETETESADETEIETETETEIETEAETETEIETEAETETETEIETETETEGLPEDVGAFVQVSCYDGDDNLTGQYVDGAEFKLLIQLDAPTVMASAIETYSAADTDAHAESEPAEDSDVGVENYSVEDSDTAADSDSVETYSITLDEHFTDIQLSGDQSYTFDEEANTITFSVQSANVGTGFTITGNVSYGEEETETASETAPVVGNAATVMLLSENSSDSFTYSTTTSDGLTVTATITGITSMGNAKTIVFTPLDEDDSEYAKVISGEQLGKILIQERRMYRISFVDEYEQPVYFDDSFDMELSLSWKEPLEGLDQSGVELRAYLYNNYNYGGYYSYTTNQQTIREESDNTYTINLSGITMKENQLPCVDFLTTDGRLAEINNGSISLKYNQVRDALINDPAYAKYYNANSPIGTAGSFHIVAFDTATLNVHTNGNILAKNLVANANFGTNNMTDELSYVQNYQTVQSTSASKAGHYLVLGSGNTIGLTDNDNALTVKGTKIDTPKNLIQDYDSSTPFVDLIRVENEIKSISNNLAAYSSSGESIMTAVTTGDNIGLTLKNPDYVCVFHATAAGLSAITGVQREFKLQGFSQGHSGAIILNIDCTGYSGDLELPNSTVYVDGTPVSKNETTDFSAGKVIWNFINAENTKIKVQAMTGMILAPESNIELSASFNGTAVGNNVTNSTETHRTDFTGKIVPTEDTNDMGAHIHVYKVDKENYGTLLQGATFALYEWDTTTKQYVAATWENESTSKSNIKITDASGSVLFQNLKYNMAYKLVETEAPDGYELSEDALYFYFANSDIEKYPVSKPDDFTASASDDCLIHYYPNTAEEKDEDKTDISVVKKWYSDNKECTANTNSVQIQLYQILTPVGENCESSESAYNTPVTLSITNGWKYTFKNLPLYQYDEESGEPTGTYTYYLKEVYEKDYSPEYLDEEGKAVNAQDPITSGTITVKNHISNDTYLLPETGGCGTTVYTAGGLLLLMMAGCFLMYNNYNNKKRGKRT